MIVEKLVYLVLEKDWDYFQKYIFKKGFKWSGDQGQKLTPYVYSPCIVYQELDHNSSSGLEQKVLSYSSVVYYEEHHSSRKCIKFNSRKEKLERILNE